MIAHLVSSLTSVPVSVQLACDHEDAVWRCGHPEVCPCEPLLYLACSPEFSPTISTEFIPQSLNTHTAYLEHISIGAEQVKQVVTPYTIGSQSIDHDD